MKTVVIIQARINSTRLSGKALMDIDGKPMLWHVLNRATKIKGVDKVCLTVPYDQGDIFLNIANIFKVEIFEGPHPDLLTSYMEVAIATKAKTIVRITGDCPFICPEISEKVLNLFIEDNSDYTSNTNPPTNWPEGIDTEIFSIMALETTQQYLASLLANTQLKNEYRHHVTLFMRKYLECTFLPTVNLDKEFSHHKLSVDTQKDLDLARKIYSKLPGPYWKWEDLEKVLKEGC